MRSVTQILVNLRLLVAASALLWFSISHAQTQDHSSIGVFQFVATTIDVVGLEDDVSYIVRNELRKAPNLLVINQRELELALSRNDIEQKFSAQEAVKAASILNLNYVIVGQVSREAQQIVANVEVVSPVAGKSVGALKFTFSNQAQIAMQSSYIGERLDEVISNHKLNAQAAANNLGEDWLKEISADFSGGLVSLSWSLSDPSLSFLGFNVYRSSTQQGPFSYIASEAELSAKDNPGNDPGTFYYQLSMINDEGDEVRSQQLASVEIQAQVESSLQAPTIVNVTERVSGLSLEFFPSADNVEKSIMGYELVRRASGEEWQVVGTYNVPQSRSGQNSSASNQMSIEKLSLADSQAQSIKGKVFYGVRAFSAQEKGQITEALEYIPASAPQLSLASNATLREISLAWQPATAGFGYKVYRRLDNADDWRLLSELNGLDKITYTDTQITQEDKVFEYAVTVFDDFGETQRSQSLIAQSKSALKPPKDVKGVSGLARKAVVTWAVNQDPNVVGYSIFRAPYTQDKEFTLTRIGEINDPKASTFTDKTVLQDNTEYYYSVAAINKFNSSGPVSKAVLIKTKTPPSSLSTLQAVLGEQAIELSWQLPANANIADIDRVQIERSYDGKVFEKIAEVSALLNAYSDKQIISGAALSYRALVIDKDGLISEPVLSGETQITLPLLLSVPQEGMLRKISLAWQNASTPAVVKVFRGTEQQNLALVAQLSNLSENTYIDEKDLSDDKQYFIKIEAWLAGNKLAESNIVTSTTKNIPAPKGLNAQSDLPKKIVLSWQAVNDDSIVKYVLFRRDLSQSDSQLVSIAQIDDVKTTSYTDAMFTASASSQQSGNSIEHGTQYEYAIASKNIFDATGYIGNTVTAASKRIPLPAHSVNVSTKATSIDLQWSLGDEADLKQVIIAKKWPFESVFSVIEEQSASTTSFSDTNLYPYVNPEYKLSVIDADGLSSAPTMLSNIENVKTSTLSVLQDDLLRKIQLGWDTLHPNISVIVKRRQNGSNWQTLATVDSSIKEYTDSTNFIDQTQYEYKLALQTKTSAPFMLGESNIVTANTKALPPAPTLNATSGLVKQIQLTWQASTDPDVGGYNLYKIDNSGKLEKLDSFTPAQTTYTDEGSFFSKLDDGTQYNYKIASFNTYKVEGLHGETIQASTKALPSIPATLSAQIDADSVRLNWAANQEADIATYEVYRGGSCSRLSVIGKVSPAIVTYADSDVKVGRSYCYKVKAVDITKLESALSLGAEVSLPEAAK